MNSLDMFNGYQTVVLSPVKVTQFFIGDSND